ncbi:MAG TPA: Hsp20/alpha crystallin family protein [Candidatus Omnitrophota bacterium]|nr:Hsp20/alpha crystallin family protein [Candidatus Omnitrophota bacterium]HPB67600.1 Hsp20/alpha crystallin family protein [Candidatus Omnitrophota bacterium]HQO57877.1 Hsp20/alpha crystallin family protein [Candidatus Omnitrophota bacterium]HQP11481.1 Hsp20/alpha crystallin family protein [Candidatus Omnitrophota bacterium]
MALIPYRRENWWLDPFAELENIQKQMNQIFDFSLSRGPWGDATLLGGQWSPAVDIYDSQDNFLVKADLPGLTKDEIEVSIQNNNLILKGEKKKDGEIKEEDYFRTERFYGSFCRMIPLPDEVDAGKVDAQYQDGVLTLTLPKKEEAKPKQITINVK